MEGHARSLMTNRIISITPQTVLSEIARALAAGGFGGVPVVDTTRRVVGLVSEVDLLGALLKGCGPATAAAQIMSSPAITVDEFDTTDEVVRLFRERQIRHLPVVRQDRLVGMITPADVIRFLAERLPPDRPDVA